MRVHLPESQAEALRLLDGLGEDGKVLAGGTALMILLRMGLVDTKHLVALDRLAGLDGIEAAGDMVQLGALVRFRELGLSPKIRSALPALSDALRFVANHRVRNRATIGGNLAESDYASDPPAILMAYGCRVRLVSASGERWVPLSEFLIGYYETALEPGELLVEVQVDRPPADASAVYLKYTSRTAEDRPCIGVMASVRLDDRRRCRSLQIAIAGATAVPFMLSTVASDCVGTRLDEQALEAVGAEYGRQLQPIADHRGSAEYRKQVSAVLVHRALGRALEGVNGAFRL